MWTEVVFRQNEKNGWGKSSKKSNALKISKKKCLEKCHDDGKVLGQKVVKIEKKSTFLSTFAILFFCRCD